MIRPPIDARREGLSALSDYSTDALLAEIVRRRNAAETDQPVEHWCEDCAHFKHSRDERDTANNCQKGHVMAFRMPDDEPDDEYGFYRRVCGDRRAKPTPPASPPPARSRPQGVRK